MTIVELLLWILFKCMLKEYFFPLHTRYERWKVKVFKSLFFFYWCMKACFFILMVTYDGLLNYKCRISMYYLAYIFFFYHIFKSRFIPIHVLSWTFIRSYFFMHAVGGGHHQSPYLSSNKMRFKWKFLNNVMFLSKGKKNL